MIRRFLLVVAFATTLTAAGFAVSYPTAWSFSAPLSSALSLGRSTTVEHSGPREGWSLMGLGAALILGAFLARRIVPVRSK